MARTEEACEYDEPLGLLWPAGVLAVVVTVGIMLAGIFGWPGVSIAAFGAIAGLFSLRGRRRGVRLDAGGLVVRRWFQRERFVPWSDVTRVEVTNEGVRLETASDPVDFGPSCRYSRVVALHAEQVLAAGPPPPALDTDTVEAMLGGAAVAVGATPGSRTAAGWRWPIAVGLAAIGALLLWNALGYGFGQWSLRWSLVAMLPFVAWQALQERTWRGVARRMVADAQGVSITHLLGRRFVPWGDVAEVVQDADGQWQLLTLRGQFAVPPGLGRETFLKAVRAVLAARDQGAALPRLEGAGDAALSRAEQVAAASPERGISRAV